MTPPPSLFTLKQAQPVIDGVALGMPMSMTVEAGEVVVLSGPNGSGKTSLLHGIMGLPGVDLRAEEMSLNGEPLQKLSVQERVGKGIALAFQQPPQLPGVKVIALIRALLAAKEGQDVSYGAAYAAAREVLPLVGLQDEVLDRDVHVGFSGGERRRLELLQILLMKPVLALLDEPDAGLDEEGIELLRGILERLTAQGAGIVLVTHQPSTRQAISTLHTRVLDMVP